MKISIPKTPIQKLNYSINRNNIYMKRDDLLPFSFGGNKVRIAGKYFEEILHNGYDYVISFGASTSNMNRVVANLSAQFNLPCCIILPKETANHRDSFNRKMLGLFDVEIIEAVDEDYAAIIKQTIRQARTEGYQPYYIYGNEHGLGHETVAMQAYHEAFQEITAYEKERCTFFDLIFFASGTGITQAGLISGQIEGMDLPRIIGISVSRDRHHMTTKIFNHLRLIYGDDYTKLFLGNIIFCDNYIAGGYGKYNTQITQTIKTLLETDGIALNTTYTGKAFWGMKEYLRAHNIQNQNILFINTGGTPQFFDFLNSL